MIPHRQVFVGPTGSCFATCIAAILDLELSHVPNFVAFGRGRWMDALILWARARRVHFRIIHDAKKVPKRGLYIASGKSPRRPLRHAVIYRAGKLVHDPYPGGEGLRGEPTHYYVVRRCRRVACKICDTGTEVS